MTVVFNVIMDDENEIFNIGLYLIVYFHYQYNFDDYLTSHLNRPIIITD